MIRHVFIGVITIVLAVGLGCSSQPGANPTLVPDATAQAPVQSPPTATIGGAAGVPPTESSPATPTEPTLTSLAAASTEQPAASPTVTTTAQPTPTRIPPPTATPIPVGERLTGKVVWGDLVQLFTNTGLVVNPVAQKVSVLSLDGTELATQSGAETFEFRVPAGDAYLLKVRTTDGVVLWALTPPVSGDTAQDISLQTSYEGGLIYAAAGAGRISGESIPSLKEQASLAFSVGADRLVNTVKRVVNNALLWRVDYSIIEEVNPVTLRAFGGGLKPVRSLDSVATDPEPDYVPHIYMLNTAAGEFFLDRILMSELKANRWTVIVIAEKIPPRVYRGLGGLHMVHGGSTLVYGKDQCYEWKTESECRSFRQVLVTKPLDAPPDEPATVVTSMDTFPGANRPQWSWDERRIAFGAAPLSDPRNSQIHVINRDGTGLTQLTFESEDQPGAGAPSWSPDNSQIVYVAYGNKFGGELWVMNADGSEPRNLGQGRIDFPQEPKFAPDGRHILFFASDDIPTNEAGGPDDELWIMDSDGTNLRKVTNNDVEDQSPVWGLNGIDVVYTVTDAPWSVGNGAWASINVFTAKNLYEFDGVLRGWYVSPVLAATEHVLVPSQAAIDAAQVTEAGYVKDDWIAELKAEIEAKQEARESTSAYTVTTPSKDPISGIRYEIWTAFTETPIYQSDVGGWIAPIISWP